MIAVDNEFVIKKCDGELLRFSNNDIVVYGNLKEAHDDCSKGETVVPFSELPSVLLNEILNQNNNKLKIMIATDKQLIRLSKSVLERDLNETKSIFCSMVLRLMDTDEYSCNYCRSLELVLLIFPEVDRVKLEKELDKYI